MPERFTRKRFMPEGIDAAVHTVQSARPSAIRYRRGCQLQFPQLAGRNQPVLLGCNRGDPDVEWQPKGSQRCTFGCHFGSVADRVSQISAKTSRMSNESRPLSEGDGWERIPGSGAR